MNRRAFLAATTALGLASVTRAWARAPRSRLILLGTGGGPSPKRLRSAPASALVVDGAVYVIDCGDGVGRQLALAGLALNQLRAVFITHQHSDHNADYGNLLLFSWIEGARSPIDTYGPPPLARMTSLFLEMNDYDIQTRIRDEGRGPLKPLIRPHEVTGAGLVMKDDRIAVRAVLNHHPPVEPSFAYRFDAPDRSIVFSGDTSYSDKLVELARGADVLVHEVIYLPGVDRLVERFPNASRLRQHLLDSHTGAEDVGRVAAAAGVKTLVLSHFTPEIGRAHV